MKKIFFIVFCLGVLLSYFLAFKAGEAGLAVSFGGLSLSPSYGKGPSGYNGPAGRAASAAAVSAAPVKKRARRQAAVKPGSGLPGKSAALKKPEHRRKKRISRLQEPGEAMGGEAYCGVSTGPAAARVSYR